MKPKIAIVVSTYYKDISGGLLYGVNKVFNDHGINDQLTTNQLHVPGAFELPIVIARNIDSFDAFIALGCIIKGKTPHFELLSNVVTNAIMDLSIQNKKPIGNGIITCLNKKQALERVHTHKTNKGKEAAIAVLSVLKILKENYAPS